MQSVEDIPHQEVSWYKKPLVWQSAGMQNSAPALQAGEALAGIPFL